MSDATQKPQRITTPIVARVVMELAVVFLGVYGAFALSEYESRKEARARREQIQAALVIEIRDITSNSRRVAEQLPQQLSAFDSAVAAGSRPPLQPWIEPIRVQNHVWEATLASGALDLFDVPTVYRLSQFYNGLNAGFEQLEQLRELSESVLIPALGSSSDEFYDSRGHLRPKYAWYRDGLGRLARIAVDITSEGDSLVAQLSPRN